MDFESLRLQLQEFQRDGLKLFLSCSFQTHSLPLLHMISRIDNGIPVVFIDTGYHFPQTLEFRDRVMEVFGMQELIVQKSALPKTMQMNAHGRLLYTSDPDFCCQVNKVDPLDLILRVYDVWINGVRADQSQQRNEMSELQAAPHGTKRLHPMLDWSTKDIWRYIREYDLPRHPLESKGYSSIGCEPCTRRISEECTGREGRWYGMNKTECGLHTELIS